MNHLKHLEHLLQRARLGATLQQLSQLDARVNPATVVALHVDWTADELDLTVQGLTVQHAAQQAVPLPGDAIHRHPQLHEQLVRTLKGVVTSDDLHVLDQRGTLGGTTTLPVEGGGSLTLLLHLTMPALPGLSGQTLQAAVQRASPQLHPLLLGQPAPRAATAHALGVAAAHTEDAAQHADQALQRAREALTTVLFTHESSCIAEGLRLNALETQAGWDSTGADRHHGPLRSE